MQVMGLQGRALAAGALLIGVLAAPAVAQSPTTVPDAALAAAPVVIDAVLEPGTSLEGTIAVNGTGINRGVMRLVVDSDEAFLVQLSIDGSDTRIRGINEAEGPWGCLQTSSCGGRVRYRIDALQPLLTAADVRIRVNAEARDPSFDDAAVVSVEAEASGSVEPIPRVVARETVTLSPEAPAGAVTIEWAFAAPDTAWELLFLTDPAIDGRSAPRPLSAEGPRTTPTDVIAWSDDPCPDERCAGRAVLRLGPDVADEVGELTAYAIVLGLDPNDPEPATLGVRSAPIATATGSVVLDAAAPDALIPVFVGADGPQRFDVYAYVDVVDLAGDLYEPISVAIDPPGPDRAWQTQVAQIDERRPDGLANYELALASRPAYRGDATVTAMWTVLAVATPYEDVPAVTTVEIRTGEPARVTFVEGEQGDPARPLETDWWGWIWRIGLSTAALLAAAAAAVIIWRRGIRVRHPVG